jgi:hypothetical protein
MGRHNQNLQPSAVGLTARPRGRMGLELIGLDMTSASQPTRRRVLLGGFSNRYSGRYTRRPDRRRVRQLHQCGPTDRRYVPSRSSTGKPLKQVRGLASAGTGASTAPLTITAIAVAVEMSACHTSRYEESMKGLPSMTTFVDHRPAQPATTRDTSPGAAGNFRPSGPGAAKARFFDPGGSTPAAETWRRWPPISILSDAQLTGAHAPLDAQADPTRRSGSRPANAANRS